MFLLAVTSVPLPLISWDWKSLAALACVPALLLGIMWFKLLEGSGIEDAGGAFMGGILFLLSSIACCLALGRTITLTLERMAGWPRPTTFLLDFAPTLLFCLWMWWLLR
tara:strand:+ start:32360 stop:32686 length:327 start_codon:yes stop_codon:yes gene_type:complete